MIWNDHIRGNIGVTPIKEKMIEIQKFVKVIWILQSMSLIAPVIK